MSISLNQKQLRLNRRLKKEHQITQPKKVVKKKLKTVEIKNDNHNTVFLVAVSKSTKKVEQKYATYKETWIKDNN